jgi:hypothetical protein
VGDLVEGVTRVVTVRGWHTMLKVLVKVKAGVVLVRTVKAEVRKQKVEGSDNREK